MAMGELGSQTRRSCQGDTWPGGWPSLFAQPSVVVLLPCTPLQRLRVRVQGPAWSLPHKPPEPSVGPQGEPGATPSPPCRVDLGSPSSLFLGRASPHSVPRSPLPCAALHQEQPQRPSLGRGRLPVPQVAAHDLCQAVAPEEAAEHNAGLLLVPAEVLAHGDGADGHADAGAVQQAGAQEQRGRPCLALGPVGDEAQVRRSPPLTSLNGPLLTPRTQAGCGRVKESMVGALLSRTHSQAPRGPGRQPGGR